MGSQLQGTLLIFDEPSIGLHQRDNHRLIDALKNLRDVGNSVLVVEHDKDIMMAADYLIDIGPQTGSLAVARLPQGTPAEVLKSGSDTASYLNGIKNRSAWNAVRGTDYFSNSRCQWQQSQNVTVK